MFGWLKEQVSDDVLLLINSILNDDGWKQLNKYEFGNGKVIIWTANGADFIDFVPEIEAFNSTEKYNIHRAIKTRIIENAIN